MGCTRLALSVFCICFFFQAEDGIRDRNVTGVQTCALPISVVVASSSPRTIGVVFSAVGGMVSLSIVATVVVLASPRSEERRVGKEWRSGGGSDDERKK